MVVLVDAKIVEQLLAVQLREATHNELEVLANVLKLPVHIKLVKVLAMVFPGLSIVLIAHVLWRGLLGALVLWTRHGEIDEVFAPELRVNQGLIGVEECQDVAKAGFVARGFPALSKRVYARSFSISISRLPCHFPNSCALRKK